LFRDDSVTSFNILCNLNGEKVPLILQNLGVFEVNLLGTVIELLHQEPEVEFQSIKQNSIELSLASQEWETNGIIDPTNQVPAFNGFRDHQILLFDSNSDFHT
jgi:hypothetical protein